MTVTYQTEPLADCREEIAALLKLHWDEVALDHDAIPLDTDWTSYEQMDREGQLAILTARKDGRVIGYHVTIVKPHLHYASTLHGFVDVYFVHPDHRKGMTGVRLFIEAEKALAKRGVVKIFSGTKKHLDMSLIFERLGWRPTETLYSKVIVPKP